MIQRFSESLPLPVLSRPLTIRPTALKPPSFVRMRVEPLKAMNTTRPCDSFERR